MSERAAALLDALKTDQELQSQMSAAATGEERKQIVTDAGFEDVSASDLKAEMAAQGVSEELSEEQLGAASGAGGFAFNPPYLLSIGGGW